MQPTQQPPLLPPQRQRHKRPASQDRRQRCRLQRSSIGAELPGRSGGQHLLHLHAKADQPRSDERLRLWGAGEPCVPPANLPYFRPNANVTRGQTSKIVANTFYPNCR